MKLFFCASSNWCEDPGVLPWTLSQWPEPLLCISGKWASLLVTGREAGCVSLAMFSRWQCCMETGGVRTCSSHSNPISSFCNESFPQWFTLDSKRCLQTLGTAAGLPGVVRTAARCKPLTKVRTTRTQLMPQDVSGQVGWKVQEGPVFVSVFFGGCWLEQPFDSGGDGSW